MAIVSDSVSVGTDVLCDVSDGFHGHPVSHEGCPDSVLPDGSGCAVWASEASYKFPLIGWVVYGVSDGSVCSDVELLTDVDVSEVAASEVLLSAWCSTG